MKPEDFKKLVENGQAPQTINTREGSTLTLVTDPQVIEKVFNLLTTTDDGEGGNTCDGISWLDSCDWDAYVAPDMEAGESEEEGEFLPTFLHPFGDVVYVDQNGCYWAFQPSKEIYDAFAYIRPEAFNQQPPAA